MWDKREDRAGKGVSAKRTSMIRKEWGGSWWRSESCLGRRRESKGALLEVETVS
jgi:hypothetical protein